MAPSSFTIEIEVPRTIRWVAVEGLRSFSREDFYAYLWEIFDGELLGIHEGTLLTEEAQSAGLEESTWTVDSAEAPAGRDWIDSQPMETAVIYFGSVSGAENARNVIHAATGLECGKPVEQKDEDWDANWKASFQGVSVPPHWEILPPWRESPSDPKSKIIRINPGAGFGTGTHETTQLCLQAIAFALRGEVDPSTRVLDFGSGSGILSIAAARLGASVDGVEIDPLAVDNATENLALNVADGALRGSVRFVLRLEDLGATTGCYPVVIANILRPVLVEFSEKLVGALARPGKIVLSGLIATDLPEVITRYSFLMGGIRPQIFERGEWRALVFEG